MSGILYTISTPIGNLDDITQRALKTLNSVDYILCEDTRVSSKLLSKFDIKSKLIPYHKFNEKELLHNVINDLENNLNIALISDAGTPCISDPGRVLVNALFDKSIKVVPVCGPCAISTLLSAAPKNNEEFAFVGFIPRNSNEQKELFEKYSNIDTVFYESPNRILKTLQNIKNFRGANAKITMGRELTKIYEEIKYSTVNGLIEHFSERPPKGEFVILLYKAETNSEEDINIDKKIKLLSQKGFSAKDISIIISTLFNMNKNAIYKKLTENKL